MENIVIRQLEQTDKEAFLRYAADWKKETSPFKIEATERYPNFKAEDFEAYQTDLRRQETTPKQTDYSTATHYFAFVEGEIAGEVSCRWQIEKGILLEWGGHIGYGVAPSFRGHGLAQEMVKFVLPEYRKRGILRVMISADEGNWASRKTIEAVGGLLENTVLVEDERVCRYWVELP